MHINQKRKTTSHLLFDEIICAIVFGSIPCLLVLQFSGVEGLVSFFEGITPPDYLIYYFLLLTILHSVVWAISKYSLSLSDSSRTFKYRLHALSYQVGFNLVGFYRAIAGSLPFIAIPILIYDSTRGSIFKAIFMLLFSIASLLAAYWLTYWQQKTVPRIKEF
ncbi:hypothetical protein HHL01_04180 [Pseudoalteromonas arctica]|uniref:Uncharacterized protein n=1 Tax=Pseudoalteromonas arctica TaxID=394751 RepID=A0A7X9U4A5_9GAMM|nr:hypothetical protein [Pseudoalteromonas arctica]NMF47377.1 hypothetical protein [Pseudoalteromonas arctica]